MNKKLTSALLRDLSRTAASDWFARERARSLQPLLYFYLDVPPISRRVLVRRPRRAKFG